MLSTGHAYTKFYKSKDRNFYPFHINRGVLLIQVLLLILKVESEARTRMQAREEIRTIKKCHSENPSELQGRIKKSDECIQEKN